MKTGIHRSPRLTIIAVLAAGVMLIAGCKRVAEVKVRGFMDEIVSPEIVPNSMPQTVELLAQTKSSRDSLDLVLMSKWAINYLAGTVTVDKNYASSYGNWPLNMPPYAIDGDNTAMGDTEVRNALAFVLMRQMSDIQDAADIQKGMRDRILSYQHPCGLFNPPLKGETDVLWATAWMARSLIEEFVTTGNREALTRAEVALKAVRQYAVKSNEKGQLRLDPPKELALGGTVIHFRYNPNLDFCVVDPFVRYYEVTGDRTMLDVATGLVEGRLAGFGHYETRHTHSFWHAVTGVAHLGAVTGEKRYLDWVENQLTIWSSMRSDTGWFEATTNYGSAETCAVADLMHVCAYLARAGRTSYYDLLERTVRNFLPQEQFFVNDEKFLALWRKRDYKNRDEHLALVKRMEGGFLCRTTPVDRWAKNQVSLEGCCPPTGMTGLYLAWMEIVRKTPQGIWVNLAFNRDCEEARVVSFLPELGRLTVVAKQAGTYHVRIPGFAPREQVAAWRDGRKSAKVIWTNDYVTFAAVKQGEEISVTYPLVRFDQKMKRGGMNYRTHWKGNAVVGIEPKGTTWPLFEKVPYPIPPYNGEAARYSRRPWTQAASVR